MKTTITLLITTLLSFTIANEFDVSHHSENHEANWHTPHQVHDEKWGQHHEQLS